MEFEDYYFVSILALNIHLGRFVFLCHFIITIPMDFVFSKISLLFFIKSLGFIFLDYYWHWCAYLDAFDSILIASSTSRLTKVWVSRVSFQTQTCYAFRTI